MNTPSGLVIARSTARNTTICIQPLVVISEFLRSQQRIQQVDHQTGAYNEHDDRFSIHIDCLRRFVLSEFDRRIAHNQATARRTLSQPRQRSRLAYWISSNEISTYASHHEPCLRPIHHISPTVAVFCSFFSTPALADR